MAQHDRAGAGAGVGQEWGEVTPRPPSISGPLTEGRVRQCGGQPAAPPAI
jgi:hypothetical protein